MKCTHFHDSCTQVLAVKTLNAVKYSFKMYSFVHIIPMLIFKFKDLKNKKIKLLFEAISKIIKSMLFFTGFNINFRILGCLLSRIDYFLNEGKFLRCLILCIGSCFASLFDSNERIIDYACYTFPKAVEGLWDLLVKLNILREIKNGDRYIFAILIGLTVFFNKYYSDHIPKNYKNIYKLFFGKE